MNGRRASSAASVSSSVRAPRTSRRPTQLIASASAGFRSVLLSRRRQRALRRRSGGHDWSASVARASQWECRPRMSSTAPFHRRTESCEPPPLRIARLANRQRKTQSCRWQTGCQFAEIVFVQRERRLPSARRGHCRLRALPAVRDRRCPSRPANRRRLRGDRPVQRRRPVRSRFTVDQNPGSCKAVAVGGKTAGDHGTRRQ
jgi:hypothetical protein